MKFSQWRGVLPQGVAYRSLRSWLTEKGSLTRRLQGLCTDFRVRLLAYGPQPPVFDELAGARPLRTVREVLLVCDGKPVIFAHTLLLTATRGRLGRWLAGLGSRSLGSLLFTHPGFVRGSLEYCRLDQRHPLYQRAACHAEVPSILWARRSSHRLGGQTVMVTEVFLPSLLQLKCHDLPQIDAVLPSL